MSRKKYEVVVYATYYVEGENTEEATAEAEIKHQLVVDQHGITTLVKAVTELQKAPIGVNKTPDVVLTFKELKNLAEFSMGHSPFVEELPERLTITEFCLQLALEMAYHRELDIELGLI